MNTVAAPSISRSQRQLVMAACALAIAGLACGPNPNRSAAPEDETPSGDASARGVEGNSTGGSTAPGNTTGGTSGSQGTGGSQGAPSPDTNGTPIGSGGSFTDVPCDVGAIIRSRCTECHGASPRFGAPMSLVRAADFRNKAKDGTKTVGQAVIARINDDAHPMPQPPADRLSMADRATLTAWINKGAPAGICSATGPDPAKEGSADAGAPSTPDDPDVTCYELRAHSTAGKKTPWEVPNQPDLYHCFNFAPPWGNDKVHLVSWKPLIDNDKVIHHWLLYNDTKPVTDGADADCNGIHPSAALVGGWAPGGNPMKMPPDVGQDVSGPGFTLEIHYNNSSAGKQPDASGVQVCVTKKLRTHEAGVHWLGTEVIFLPLGGIATGVCRPQAKEPVTILSATPHMHLQGRRMTTVINRANGMTDMLIDKPFDFNTQISYPTPQVVMPGDTLTTTCQYGGPAFFGEGTKQEMCYDFVLAYPNGALSSGSALRKNGCTGL